MQTIRRLRLWCSLFLPVLATACQSAGDLRERLDARTGITWTTERAPAVFARTDTRYSRSARDYVYLGPVEINRRGTRDYYLWVGVATTLDRGYLAPTLEPPTALYMEIGGELMEFVLQDWSTLGPVAGGDVAYATPMELQTDLAARVTANQIELLATEPPSAIRIMTPNASTREYVRWQNGMTWEGFIE